MDDWPCVRFFFFFFEAKGAASKRGGWSAPAAPGRHMILGCERRRHTCRTCTHTHTLEHYRSINTQPRLTVIVEQSATGAVGLGGEVCVCA